MATGRYQIDENGAVPRLVDTKTGQPIATGLDRGQGETLTLIAKAMNHQETQLEVLVDLIARLASGGVRLSAVVKVLWEFSAPGIAWTDIPQGGEPNA